MNYLEKIKFEEIDRYNPPQSHFRMKSPKRSLFGEGSYRNAVILIFACLGLFILIYRAFELQVVEGKRNFDASVNNSIRSSLLHAERGVIYDRNGVVLVRNRPAFSVSINMSECKSFCDQSIQEVASLLKTDPGPLFVKTKDKIGIVSLVPGLSRDQDLIIESNLASLDAVSTQVDPVRVYTNPLSIAHVIGTIGESDTGEYEGKSGIERKLDSFLRGTSGSRIIEVNSQGTYYTQIAEKKPISGKNVALNIDSGLQQVSYNALRDAVEKKHAQGGAVVATDPNSGAVLALVSYPSFDPNAFSSGISEEDLAKLTSDPRKPFFNRAISALYPPGSTFKMVTALAGLESQVISPDSTVPCPPYINVGSFVYHDWYSGGRGDIDVEKALQVSCDTFFYQVGGGFQAQKGVGINNLATLARKLGFGTKSGIDLDGEEPGIFPDPAWKISSKNEPWYLGDTYITSIGQGNILATPLQINEMTSFFASRGKVYRPKLIKSIDGVGEFEPEVIQDESRFNDSIDVVREGLRRAVLPGGTAYPLYDFAQRHPGIELAGKTGTAEFGNPVEVGGEKTHAWFTVFGPYNNPNIVLTVLLEGGGSGADDAAPVAKQILDYWFK